MIYRIQQNFIMFIIVYIFIYIPIYIYIYIVIVTGNFVYFSVDQTLKTRRHNLFSGHTKFRLNTFFYLHKHTMMNKDNKTLLCLLLY